MTCGACNGTGYISEEDAAAMDEGIPTTQTVHVVADCSTMTAGNVIDMVAVPRELLGRILSLDPLTRMDEDGDRECFFCGEDYPREVWCWSENKYYRVTDRFGHDPDNPMYGHSPECPYFELLRLMEGECKA